METKLIIQNLKCGGCAHTITEQLSTLESISDVEVDPNTDSVQFCYQSESGLKLVKDKLKQLGYPVHGDANSYWNKARSFVSCATGKLNS